jgi:hypothetical protein
MVTNFDFYSVKIFVIYKSIMNDRFRNITEYRFDYEKNVQNITPIIFVTVLVMARHKHISVKNFDLR